MFNLNKKSEKDIFYEVVKNSLTIFKTSFIYNKEFGFDWIALISDPLRSLYWRSEIATYLKSVNSRIKTVDIQIQSTESREAKLKILINNYNYELEAT